MNLDLIQLDKIYFFLKKNNKHNKHLQLGKLNRVFKSVDTKPERARLLLHNAFNSQSQPKINLYCEFIKPFFDEKNTSSLSSLKNLKIHFCKILNLNEKNHFEYSMFELLKCQPGWGEKTAALFVKNLYLISTHDILKNSFWTDIDQVNNEIECLELPVDAVIKRIFNSQVNVIKNAIEKYNLEKKFKKQQIVIWDDLWFWGFITQNSQETEERILEWNEAKLMSNFDAQNMNIPQIKKLALEFIKLVK